MPRRRALDRRARAHLPNVILERARETDLLQECGPGEDGDRRALHAARRLAVRPEGHADRRRTACVRAVAPGRACATRSIAATRRRCADELGARRSDRSLRRGGTRRRCSPRSTAVSSRPDRAARRRAAASTCFRPAAISSPSIRARCRRAPPGRSASARPRRCSTAMRRTMASGRRGSSSTSGAAPPCAPAATISRKRWRCIGVRPLWDHGSARVSGFEILPLASLGRPRVDVTLRISGLFRDVFPGQIALFDAAVRAVAATRRGRSTKIRSRRRAIAATSAAHFRRRARAPTASASRARLLSGDWRTRDDLGEVYLAATSHAYGGDAKAKESRAAFADARRERGRLRPCAGQAEQDAARFRRLRRTRGRLCRGRAMLGNDARRLSPRRDAPGRDQACARLPKKSPRVVRGRASQSALACKGRCVTAIAAPPKSPRRSTISMLFAALDRRGRRAGISICCSTRRLRRRRRCAPSSRAPILKRPRRSRADSTRRCARGFWTIAAQFSVAPPFSRTCGAGFMHERAAAQRLVSRRAAADGVRRRLSRAPRILNGARRRSSCGRDRLAVERYGNGADRSFRAREPSTSRRPARRLRRPLGRDFDAIGLLDARSAAENVRNVSSRPSPASRHAALDARPISPRSKSG